MEFVAATTDADSFTVPLFQRAKFCCASVHSLNFAEPLPLFEKACPEPFGFAQDQLRRREGPGEIFS
jgi:hypothetical protein